MFLSAASGVGWEALGLRPPGLEVTLATISVVKLRRARGLLVRAMQEGPFWPWKACRPNLDMPGRGPRADHCLAWPWLLGQGKNSWIQQGSGFKNQFTVH